ncbi:MAG TPA: GNAT family N-acetyltransferase [Longimicrobiaceae bacterium]
MSVRPAEPDDVEALARIAAAREGQEIAEARETIARRLAEAAAGNGLLLVAVCGGEAVGYGGASLFSPPADAPTGCAPPGWYLSGVVVAPEWRRRGIGDRLTRERLEWIARRAGAAFYVANARNRASIALHARLGFAEVTRDFWFPNVAFTGGEGILFRVELS